MKIDCGPTRSEKRQQRLKRLSEFNRWFAWYPVRVGYRDCRWLEVVERRDLNVFKPHTRDLFYRKYVKRYDWAYRALDKG